MFCCSYQGTTGKAKERGELVLMDYAHEIIQLSDKLSEVSDEFKTACIKYSQHNYNLQKLIGLRIIRMENKKPSIEKIIAEAVAEDEKEFGLHYKGYEYYRALKTGLEAQIEALKSKIMARQSVMKWSGKMDTYGNV